MKRTPGALICVSLALTLACTKDPHKLVITEHNRENFIESIKDSKGLSVEETRLLLGFQMRNALGNTLGGTQQDIVGKTVGEVIAEERAFEESQKNLADQQKRIAAEAGAKEAAQSAELRKAVNLSVYQKSYRPADPEEGSYQDFIVIKCAYTNTSGKNIRAFKGKVRFSDLFGSQIFESGLTISDPIKDGEKANWTGTIKYNQFIDKDVRLRNTDLKDMKIDWLPSSIIFADGTTLGEE